MSGGVLRLTDAPEDAIITIDHKGIIESANQAAERMFGYTPKEMIGVNFTMLLPPPAQGKDQTDIVHYLRTGVDKSRGIGREIMGLGKNGAQIPLDLKVSEIPQLKLFTVTLDNISRRKLLERHIAEIATLEQQRTAQELHDSVAQDLTALVLMAQDLLEMVPAEAKEMRELGSKIVQGVQTTLEEIRHLSRSLMPREVKGQELAAFLVELAETTAQRYHLSCVYEGAKSVGIKEDTTATHLFYIAREAVSNAVKHGQPRNIRISLRAKDQEITLGIKDDGVGLSQELPPTHGVGLHIMQNRARIVGGQLSVQAVQPSGTLVTCTVIPEKM